MARVQKRSLSGNSTGLCLQTRVLNRHKTFPPVAAAAEQGTQEVQARIAEQPEVPVDDEPLRRFKGEAGRIKFVYAKDTGAVKDAPYAGVHATTTRYRRFSQGMGTHK